MRRKQTKRIGGNESKMKKFLLAIYAVVISAVIVALMYAIKPYVVEYPKAAMIILLLLLFSSFGAGARSMIEMGILWPMAKIANGIGKSFFTCPFIFLAAMLVATALPWLNGVSGFNAWRWISSIAFTLFNFETFYAFVGATRRMYNCDRETEYE